MKSQKEVQAQLFAFLIQAIYRDERLHIHPRCFNLWERPLERTRQEAEWDLEQVWMLQRRQKSHSLVGNTPDFPVIVPTACVHIKHRHIHSLKEGRTYFSLNRSRSYI